MHLSNYKEAIRIIESNGILFADLISQREKAANENTIIHSAALRQDASSFLKQLEKTLATSLDFNLQNAVG